MRANPSIQMIEIVAQGLGDLLSDVVFIGGATTGIYIDDAAAPEPRPTNDVDCIVEIGTLQEFHELENKLRERGFRNSKEKGAPLCRFVYQGATVDVMPTDTTILGFASRWYSEAMKQSEVFSLPSGREIRILSLAYFLATKVEAFLDRGQKEPRYSSDLEDIISVFDGVPNIPSLLGTAPESVTSYLRSELSKLRNQKNFREWTRSHVSEANRLDGVLKRVDDFLATPAG